MSEDKKKIYLVKTNEGCFITDCEKSHGYDYNYHKSVINEFYFDGIKPTETYVKNWYFISEYPKKITRQENDKQINIRYELMDVDMESKKTPLVLQDIDYDAVIYDLYSRKYDLEKGKIKKVNDYEIELLMEVDNFKMPPKMEYNAIHKVNYSDEVYKITNANIKHQWIDRMVFPEVLLGQMASEISSKNLYNLVRQHVKENIDNKVAKITSDYNFCFGVSKIVPLIEPKNFTYTDMFARTKKQRQKIHQGISKFKEFSVFEMTNDQENYKGYTPIKPITGISEEELKIRIDEFLDDLMHHINSPLIQCEHCMGSGLKEDVEKFKRKSDDA